MYHPQIAALDAKACELYNKGDKKAATRCQIEAGQLQQKLIKPVGKRYLDAQWCWAYGHLGLLQMIIRWFKHHEPSTQLILETQGKVNNHHLLKAISPYLTIVERLAPELRREAEDNAVYFACPDGIKSIHNFYKQVERECPRLDLPVPDVTDLLAKLGITHPYVAVHARNFAHEPERNVTLEMVSAAIGDELNVVSIGLDEHPINDVIPSVLKLPDPSLASFLLSAACDYFIGSNSGPWTIANAYGRPVTLMNDFERKAWIYQEDIEE
jgi:hypothetical protein